MLRLLQQPLEHLQICLVFQKDLQMISDCQLTIRNVQTSGSVNVTSVVVARPPSELKEFAIYVTGAPPPAFTVMFKLPEF